LHIFHSISEVEKKTSQPQQINHHYSCGPNYVVLGPSFKFRSRILENVYNALRQKDIISSTICCSFDMLSNRTYVQVIMI